jgi:hypothetical protein
VAAMIVQTRNLRRNTTLCRLPQHDVAFRLKIPVYPVYPVLSATTRPWVWHSRRNNWKNLNLQAKYYVVIGQSAKSIVSLEDSSLSSLSSSFGNYQVMGFA